jgi:hypothetical protein
MYRDAASRAEGIHRLFLCLCLDQHILMIHIVACRMHSTVDAALVLVPAGQETRAACSLIAYPSICRDACGEVYASSLLPPSSALTWSTSLLCRTIALNLVTRAEPVHSRSQANILHMGKAS